MPRFPIEYEVELEKKDGEPMELASGHRPPILASPPPEFGGTDAQWSPEHLLVGAAAACFAATFSSMAERASIRVGFFRCHARGALSRVESVIAFSSIELTVHVRVLEDDVSRTRALLDDAKRRCFVANSLRCPVELVANVAAT